MRPKGRYRPRLEGALLIAWGETPEFRGERNSENISRQVQAHPRVFWLRFPGKHL